MIDKSTVLAAVALALSGAAQAQTCICNGGSGTPLTTVAAVQAVLANKMVCAAVGGEQWQEWHNGGASGPVVDYKLGPGHPVDPSSQTGTYQVVDLASDPRVSKTQRAAGAAVTYTYGANTYSYGVCQTGATYVFCGVAFGGRDIAGARVSSTGGLQPCSNVAAATGAAERSRAKP